MAQNAADEILSICNTLPAQLRAIPGPVMNFKLPEKWSKQKILGHLVDSAIINIQRFVRAQIEDKPVSGYDQDDWVAIQQYSRYNTEELIQLWEAVNRHLYHVAASIPAHNLKRVCEMRDGQVLTLEFLIEDYLKHLQHHIEQIRS
jgi:hypothetical protein